MLLAVQFWILQSAAVRGCRTRRAERPRPRVAAAMADGARGRAREQAWHGHRRSRRASWADATRCRLGLGDDRGAALALETSEAAARGLRVEYREQVSTPASTIRAGELAAPGTLSNIISIISIIRRPATRPAGARRRSRSDCCRCTARCRPPLPLSLARLQARDLRRPFRRRIERGAEARLGRAGAFGVEWG